MGQITVVLNDDKLVECFAESSAAKSFIKALCDIVDIRVKIVASSMSEQAAVLEWANTNFKPSTELTDIEFKKYCDTYYKKKRQFERDLLYDLIEQEATPEQRVLFEKYYEIILDDTLDLTTSNKELL